MCSKENCLRSFIELITGGHYLYQTHFLITIECGSLKHYCVTSPNESKSMMGGAHSRLRFSIWCCKGSINVVMDALSCINEANICSPLKCFLIVLITLEYCSLMTISLWMYFVWQHYIIQGNLLHCQYCLVIMEKFVFNAIGVCMHIRRLRANLR